MAGTGDRVVLDAALVKRAASVRAAVGERVQLTLDPHDRDVQGAGLAVCERAVLEFGIVEHRRPVVRQGRSSTIR